MSRESELLALLCKRVGTAVQRVAAAAPRASATREGEAPALDAIAEQAAEEFLRTSGRSLRVRTPLRGLWTVGQGAAERLLILDPISGVHSSGGKFEPTCVSATSASVLVEPTFADVQEAAVLDLRSDHIYQADASGVLEDGMPHLLPGPGPHAHRLELESLRWSVEVSGDRVRLTGSFPDSALDEPARARAVFAGNGLAFSLLRLLTGEIASYVDFWSDLRGIDPSNGGAIGERLPHDLAAGWKIVTAVGMRVTDGNGAPLDETPLLRDPSPLQSCVAACSRPIHDAILSLIGRTLWK